MLGKISLLLSGFLLCLFVYPSSFFYPKDTLPDNNDTRLIAYIIGQVQNNITEGKNLYEATFFAPEPNTLTYSDLFLTTSLLTFPARIFTNHPILVFNIGFILNFTLTFYTSFLFFQKISKDFFGTIIATLLFNLSAFHLHYYPHLQIFSFWIFFAAIYNLINFIESKNKKFLHLFLLFTTLQLAETIFTTYLLFFAAFLVIARFRQWRNQSNPENPGYLIRSAMTNYSFQYYSAFLIYPSIWILLLHPYANTHFLYQEASRPIRDAAHFSLGLDEFFSKYQSWATLTILVIVFFHATTKEISKTARNQYLGAKGHPAKRGDTVSCEHGFWSISWWLLSFSIIMSLGPVLKIFGQTIKPLQSLGINWPIPLPYALFYYIFPGFTGFRTPSRFILLALFALCTLFAIKVGKYTHLLKTKTKILFVILIFLILAIENRLPLSGYPANINPPTVYVQVKNLPSEAIILELPIKLWNMPDHQIESIRSIYSLKHKHKRLNGYSGFATLEWIKLVEEINAYGLSEPIKQKLKQRGVTHITNNNLLSEI